MAENDRLALENERRRLNKILCEEQAKLSEYQWRYDFLPPYSKRLCAGQIIFFVFLLVSVLPNISFLLNGDQPMKRDAFTVTALCMAGLLIMLIAHIVLDVRHWIGSIRREAAVNRLRTETRKRIQDIEKELEKYRDPPPDYKIAGEPNESGMSVEYEFHIVSPFHDVKPDNTRLNLATERTLLEREADKCILSLRTELEDLDARYQKNVFVRVIRFGEYLALAAATISSWFSHPGNRTAHTAFQIFIAIGIGLVLVNIAVWFSYRSMKAQKIRYWNSRKAELEDQEQAVADELAKLDQWR